MATFLRGKDRFFSRLKSLTRFQRFNYTMGDGGLQAKVEFIRDMGSASNSRKKRLGDEVDVSKWQRIDARKFGVTRDIIPPSSMIVLQLLRNNGYDAYFVGGCVRDLLLQRTPKDFDVITTANLKQIKKVFHRAQIIGKRFPICLVHIKGSTVEVSSFETTAKNGKENEEALESPVGESKDFIRCRNSMQRDFTINSLFYDPYSNKIYDYINGLLDLRSLTLRTIIPARVSFKEDCARILRGLRIAARLNLSFSKDAVGAIRDLSSSIETLDKFRLMLEMNYMMSYGAAEGSIRLLKRFNLLEILLPFHAAYLDQQKSVQNSIMLTKLLSNLDKWLSCDRPADSTLWVGLLMFHLALVRIPQDALVVWTFASVLYHGRWEEGVKFAREHANKQFNFVPEILESSGTTTSDEDLAKLVARLASLVQDSIYVLTETNDLSLSMSQYPSSRCSGLVFIPKRIGSYVAKMFDALLNDIESYEEGRESFEINYWSLGKGNPRETRFVLGKIILETMNGGALIEEKTVAAVDDEEDQDPNTSEKPPLFEIIKREVQGRKRQRHDSSLAEPEQQKLKLPKLVETAKKQCVVDKENFQSIAENLEKAVRMHSLSEEDGNVMNGNKLEKPRSSSSHPKKTRKTRGAVGNGKHQDAAENHITPEERNTQGAEGNAKHQDGAEEKKTRKKLGFVENGKHRDGAESHKTSEKSKTRKKLQGGAENHKTSEENKTGEQKEVVVKKKDKMTSLSSLFKK